MNCFGGLLQSSNNADNIDNFDCFGNGLVVISIVISQIKTPALWENFDNNDTSNDFAVAKALKQQYFQQSGNAVNDSGFNSDMFTNEVTRFGEILASINEHTFQDTFETNTSMYSNKNKHNNFVSGTKRSHAKPKNKSNKKRKRF